jgi:hypothetical protein
VSGNLGIVGKSMAAAMGAVVGGLGSWYCSHAQKQSSEDSLMGLQREMEKEEFCMRFINTQSELGTVCHELQEHIARDGDLWDPPDAICCPITHEIMTHPVLLVGDGHTYERKAIALWLEEHDTSPMTNLVVHDPTLVANHTVKQMVVCELQEHNALDRDPRCAICQDAPGPVRPSMGVRACAGCAGQYCGYHAIGQNALEDEAETLQALAFTEARVRRFRDIATARRGDPTMGDTIVR